MVGLVWSEVGFPVQSPTPSIRSKTPDGAGARKRRWNWAAVRYRSTLGTLGCNGTPAVRDLPRVDELRPPSGGVAGLLQPFQASYR